MPYDWLRRKSNHHLPGSLILLWDVRTALELAASGGTSLDLLERAAEIWRDSTSRLPDDADFNRIAELGPPVPDETDETR